MARYTTSVFTPLSPAEAFAYMADIRHFADWDPGVANAVQCSGQGPGPSAAYDLTLSTPGHTVMRYAVTSWQAPTALRLESRTFFLTSIDDIRVVAGADGAGSVVTYDAVLTLNGPLRMFDMGLAFAFRRIGDRAAAGLARALGGRIL